VSSFGTVQLRDIWTMLEACAPGYTKRGSEHHWKVMWRGRTYPRLLLGKHGKRHNPIVEIGHVRNLVRHLGLPVDCANHHLPQLRMKSADAIFESVTVLSERPLACDVNGKRVELHAHMVRDASTARTKGTCGRLVMGEDTAACLGLPLPPPVPAPSN
jgi:hypothetical protein